MLGYPRHLLKKNIPSATTGTDLSTGLNNFLQPDQQTDLSPVTDPALKQQIQHTRQQQSDRATLEDMHNKVTMADAYNKLPPNIQQQVDQINQYKDIDRDKLHAATPDEIAGQHAMDSTVGKITKSLAYGANQFDKGFYDLAVGGSSWVLNHLNTSLTDTQIIPDSFLNNINSQVDKTTGITPGQKTQIEEGKGLGMGAARTLGMLAYIAPAAVGGSVTELPKTMFALQGIGQGVETMNSVDPDHKLNPAVRDLYIAGNGLVNGIIMGDLKENVLSRPVQDKIVSAIAADALKEAAEKGLTEDAYKETIKKTTDAFTDKTYQILNTYAEKTGQAAKDFSALQAANYVLKKGVDVASDHPVFNANLGELMQGISDVATKQAPIFGGIGAMLGGAKADPVEKQKLDIADQIQTLQESPTDGIIAEKEKAVRLKGLNQQLDEIVANQYDQQQDKASGKKITYSKGTGDEDGKFFKTIDGKKEEIEESRYKLEKPDEQPTQAKPAVEESVPAAPQESVPEKADEELTNNQITNTQNDEKANEERGQENAIEKGNGEKTVPTEEKVSEGAENAPSISVNEIINKPITYHGEPAEIIQDGQTLVAKIKDSNREYELGNVDDIGDKSIKDLGIEHQNSVVDTNDAGDITVRGKEYKNNYSDPLSAINSDKDGNVVSVNLETSDGEKRTFRGDVSEDIAYQLHLKEINKDNETAGRFEQFANSDEPTKSTIVAAENENTAEKATVADNAEVSKKPARKISKPINNAVQEQETGKVGVRDETVVREGVGGQNQSKEPAQQGEKIKVSDKAKVLADKIRSLKSDKNNAYGGLHGVATAIYDGGLETAATVIEQGGKLVDAIQAAVDHIKKNSDEKDDKKISAAITKDLSDAGISDETKRPSITSARNEDTDNIREKLGLSPLMSIAARENPEVWDEVNKTLDENPNATNELISKLDQHMRPVTDVEQGLLVHRQIELETEVQKANDLIIENKKNGIKDPWDQVNLLNARKSLSDILELQRKVGREWGLSGKFRQQLFKDDFSLANLERQTRGALGGRELTQPELDNIQKVHDEFAKKVKEYEKTIKDLQDKNKKEDEVRALEKLKRDAEFEKRKAARAGKVISEREKRSQTIDDIRAKLKDIRKASTLSSDFPLRKELAAIAPELAKLAKSYISEGVTRLEDIVDKIHHDLSADFEGLDKRDVRDALSGYGNEKTREKEELQKKLEGLKHQAKLISRLEDLKNGVKKLIPTKEKEANNAEIEELQKQIHDFTKGETMNKSYITRMKNMTIQAEKDLAELNKGTFKKLVRLPPELTPEARTARAGYLMVKRDFDRELERKRLADRPKLFKLADWGVKWRRFVLFANPTTWLKLGTYATLETLSKPLHEIVGSGVRKLPYFSKVAKMAPREGGGFNRHVEAKAFAQLWAKGTWGDILKNITNKEGDLKTSHSDNLDSTPDNPWLDIMQNWHSAIKEIPLHAEVERSIYLRTMHAMENNIDVSEPLVQMKIVAESVKDNLPGAKLSEIQNKAYQDGLRAIMMQDNIVSNSWSKVTQWLDQVAETGKISKNVDASDRFKGGAKALSTALKILLPITKVPVNYVISRLEYTPILGAAKAALVMRRGLEKMTPDDADYVMRIMKKQGISAAVLAVGYLNPSNFGGFAVTTNKRRPGQPQANDIKLFGVNMPHWMSHTPFLTIMQLGATMRHIHDNYVEGTMSEDHLKQAKKENWYSDAPLSMTRDITKQIPFIETPSQITDAVRNKQATTKFAADFIEGMVLPPDIKSLAKAQDTEHGEVVKRKTNGFGDELKSNLPILRKTLPRKH